jgi:glycosyltransferase involved in cell wall biosynthesis
MSDSVTETKAPAPGHVLRILAVLDGYRVTSPARQLFAASVGLRARGHVSEVIVIERSGGPTPLLAEAARLHIPITIVPEAFPGDPRVLSGLRHVVTQRRPHVLETHGYKANILAALLRPVLRVPWVAVRHGETRDNAKVRLYFGLERRAVRRADRVVVISEEMARMTAAAGVPHKRLCVVRSAYVALPVTGNVAPQHESGAPVVGVVARLSREKGVDLAVRAHRAVLAAHPNARLLILGEGPDRVALSTLAMNLGVAERVSWLGYQEDPTPFYRAMSVVLIPSRSEGLPQVVLESMAHGLPVVATAVGGLPEAIEDGVTGCLVAAGDVQGLGAQVVRLLDDPSLRARLGERARETVEARFSLTSKLDTLCRLYGELAS